MYRLNFINGSEVYEMYAKRISESHLFGFIEVGDFVWSNRSNLIVDTAEEKLKAEFQEVKNTLIPLQCIVRIDEVSEVGMAKIKDRGNVHHSSVTPFPSQFGKSPHSPM